MCAAPIVCIQPVFGLPGEQFLPPEDRIHFGDRPRSEVVVGTEEHEGNSQESDTRPQRARRLPPNLLEFGEVYGGVGVGGLL